jgi:transposase
MARRPRRIVLSATDVSKRAEAVALRRAGWPFRRIAKHLRCSVGFVAAAVRRNRETKSNLDRPRSGRPTIVTRQLRRRVVQLARQKRTGSVRKARAALISEGTPLSYGTVRGIVHAAGLRSYKRRKVPRLTAAHKAARLAWATALLNEPETETVKRVFADEKYFVVGGRSDRLWLYPWEPRPIKEVGKRPSLFSGARVCCRHHMPRSLHGPFRFGPIVCGCGVVWGGIGVTGGVAAAAPALLNR